MKETIKTPIALVISLVPVFLIQCVRFLEQLLTVIGFIYEKEEVKIQNVLTTGLEALFCIIFALSLLLLIFALFSKKLNRLLLFGLGGCTVASLLLCVTEGISAILSRDLTFGMLDLFPSLAWAMLWGYALSAKLKNSSFMDRTYFLPCLLYLGMCGRNIANLMQIILLHANNSIPVDALPALLFSVLSSIPERLLLALATLLCALYIKKIKAAVLSSD